jgi:hypothetical protein
VHVLQTHRVRRQRWEGLLHGYDAAVPGPKEIVIRRSDSTFGFLASLGDMRSRRIVCEENKLDNSAEQELRELVAERVAAVRAKDPAPLADRQHPDLISFNVVPPLHSRGSAAVADQTQAWFDAYASDIGYEVRELHVTSW